MGYFQTYAATEGLDRFPEDKQFCAWLTVHKKLKASDPSYRSACRRYNAKMIGVSLLFTLIMMLPGPLFLGNTVSPVSEIAWTLVGLVLAVMYVPWVLAVASRHQKLLNAEVAEEIRKESRDESD